MPTDDERREMARRLRELKNPYWHGSGSSEACMDVMGVETYLLRNGFHYDLADLIEPSCDRDALLKVADMLECDGECSECECGKGTFCEAPTIAAARIREALGVES